MAQIHTHFMGLNPLDLSIIAIYLAGITLFVVSSVGKKDEAPKTEVQAVIGPSYLGVQGSF